MDVGRKATRLHVRVQCTKKLQKEIGVKPADLYDGVGDSLLGSWHANLIYVFRRKCVLFANDKTYFNFLAIDVTRAEIRDMQGLFTRELTRALQAYDMAQAQIDRILGDYTEIGISNTNSRSVLGVMNDLAYNYKWVMEEAGSLVNVHYYDVLRSMNRMPCGAIDYASPIEELARVLSMT